MFPMVIVWHDAMARPSNSVEAGLSFERTDIQIVAAVLKVFFIPYITCPLENASNTMYVICLSSICVCKANSHRSL